MRTLTMEDKLALIVAGLTAAGVTVRSLYNSWVKDKNETSDNRRKDFNVLYEKMEAQVNRIETHNEQLRERNEKLDEKLGQYESQLKIQNRHIKKLGEMLQKAITVIEDLGANPKEHGIVDITKEA